MATFGPIARALLEEGCSGEQIAAAVAALEQAKEREREERLARLREGARMRQQRCRERRRAASRRDDVQPLPPSFPSVSPPPPPSLTPQTTPFPREGAPAREAGPLPADFEASDEDRAFGKAEGLSEEEVARSVRDLRLWAASTGPIRLDWHAEVRRFLVRDAEAKRSRGGQTASVAKPTASPGVWVRRDSPAGDAWWADVLAKTGKSPPIDKRGGWRFPTAWPPRVRAPPVEP
ncbi:hypothetical protein RZS28_03985 [Methylocapsa polymorpha]|uniref:Uncharacterized protein n=1 Tax=Methylocapsa polymorpha TaxID=3080828 RepID=A0ABZ0HVU6_9HYPH|nr:hypothetical protein RZS28_03985 [Methylocapsa sp. RX1]